MIFVGGGGDSEEIMKYATETGLMAQCIFPGIIRDRDLLRTYFSMADLFLFPSTFDTNGIVVREAAACALPSVLLLGSCAAEGITDGRTGILIDETVDAMTAAIMKAGQDLEWTREIGRHAMEEIYISWEDSVDRAVARYDTVIENYRSKVKKRPLLSEPLFTSTQIQGELEKIRIAYHIINKKRKRLNDQILDPDRPLPVRSRVGRGEPYPYGLEGRKARQRCGAGARRSTTTPSHQHRSADILSGPLNS